MEKANINEQVLEFLDCDHELVTHYENTYYLKEAELVTLRKTITEKFQELKELLTSLVPNDSNENDIYASSGTTISNDPSAPPKPTKTLQDYNEWRSTRLKSASIEEKLEWNSIRKAILTYEKWQSENLMTQGSVPQIKQTRNQVGTITGQAYKNPETSHTVVKVSQDLLKLIESLQKEVEQLTKRQHELWTQIVNYRTTLNIGNTIRSFFL